MQYPRSYKEQRLPANVQRGKKVGRDRQTSYEITERIERSGMVDRMAKDKARVRAEAAKRAPRKPGTGMNAGTVGGAYLASYSRKSR